MYWSLMYFPLPRRYEDAYLCVIILLSIQVLYATNINCAFDFPML